MAAESDYRRLDSRVRRLWHENSDSQHREPEFDRARGLGIPHRDAAARVEARPSHLLGETGL